MLGVLQGEHGMLFDNYPDNFNKIIPELAKWLISKGYLPVEPVQLEVLGDEEMKSVIKENIALLDNEEKAVELLFKVSQNTNAHNEAKGQLYRVKDD